MKIDKKIRQSLNYFFFNHSINTRDRAFVLLSMCEIAALFVSALYDLILLEESFNSVGITLLGALLFVFYLYLSIKQNTLHVARYVVAILMTLIFIPVSFFVKGGIYGGALIYTIMGCYFIVMTIEGKTRLVLCAINTVVIIICGIVSYYHPEYLAHYDRKGYYIDTIGAFIVCLLMLTVMTAFQSALYRRESQKADEREKKLEEMNKAQNRFFSSMSHEIRTPINTVLGLNEIILRQEDASEEIKKDARNIQGAGKLLLTLINDILDASKLEAGKMDIVPVDYNVAALLSDIVNMIWLKAQEKGLKFNVDIDPGVPETLFGDEVRIKQVLINLLNNAVKYTNEGSVTLYMECERLDSGDALLNISVSDTGIGIKQESLPHLFDTFKRVDETKNRYIEGTGLGLSIVKQLVELMDGEVSVNSVYSQGSTFNVSLKQGISSDRVIGDLNITGSGDIAGKETFEHSFHAPTARILIVDDNEMNLQVEKKLLEGTEMKIDLTESGQEALLLCLRNRYDIIFMDHMMPEMDGIECFEKIRTQMGGLNMSTPIIVLTANAGSENVELYNRTGFDGYLVKPVSGQQLEDMVALHLPPEKIIGREGAEASVSSLKTASRYSKKKPVAVAINTTCDLPKYILQQLDISTISCTVYTEEGAFYDNVDLDSEELVQYMRNEKKSVRSDAPSKEEYIRFFSDELMKAHHLIFISFSSYGSEECQRAEEAARSFDNVSIVRSETVSSASGILAMIAVRLSQQNYPVKRIVEELEDAKKRLVSSFVVKSSDTITRQGKLNPILNALLNTFYLRPMLRMKNDKLGVGRMFFGTTRRCYDKYIKYAFPSQELIDPSVLFVPYVGMEEEDLLWIEDKLSERVKFDHIIFQKASAGIAANCGEGTIGLQYLLKGDRSYNLGAYFDNMKDVKAQKETMATEEISEAEGDKSQEGTDDNAKENSLAEGNGKPEASSETENKWYEKLKGIDAETAIRNSGSDEMFRSVLSMFLESYEDKSKEIIGYYKDENFKDYTIKVHALKSNARIIGALKLGNDAEAVELAGKRDDIEFIKAHHQALMDEYKAMRDEIAPVLSEDEQPEITEDLLVEAYGGLMDYAATENEDLLKMVLDSVREYRLPLEEKARFDRIEECLVNKDFNGILDVIIDRACGH